MSNRNLYFFYGNDCHLLLYQYVKTLTVSLHFPMELQCTVSLNLSLSLTVCIYKGRQYQQSQSWSDGCDFDCRCDDASTGQFSCTPR